jgi:hypothetical protein
MELQIIIELIIYQLIKNFRGFSPKRAIIEINVSLSSTLKVGEKP